MNIEGILVILHGYEAQKVFVYHKI